MLILSYKFRVGRVLRVHLIHPLPRIIIPSSAPLTYEHPSLTGLALPARRSSLPCYKTFLSLNIHNIKLPFYPFEVYSLMALNIVHTVGQPPSSLSTYGTFSFLKTKIKKKLNSLKTKFQFLLPTVPGNQWLFDLIALTILGTSSKWTLTEFALMWLACFT